MKKKLTIRNFQILEKTIKYEEKFPRKRLEIIVGEFEESIRVQCIRHEVWDEEHDLWSVKVLESVLIKNPKLSKYNGQQIKERNRRMWQTVNKFYARYF